MNQIAWIGIGSNSGKRELYLRDAIQQLQSHPSIDLIDFSSIYETEPVQMECNDYFLNMVISIETSLSPLKLLRVCLDIEDNLGRKRPYPNAPRTIDLDILLFGTQMITSQLLTIPHPRMHLRTFVLKPMIEINSSILHPVFKQDMKTLFENCSSKEEISIWNKKTGGELYALFES